MRGLERGFWGPFASTILKYDNMQWVNYLDQCTRCCGFKLMMVDWLTVELPDPVGLPINDGHVLRVRADGSVDWSTHCRKTVEGSWSSTMTFRAIGAEYAEEVSRARLELGLGGVRRSGLEVSGNPAKFLQGHNLYGSDDPASLLAAVVDRARDAIWPGLSALPIDYSAAEISRIDLTASWLLDREEDVLPFLRAMEERVWCPYRGKGVMNDVGTLYYGRTSKGKRAKDWQLKLYSKGRDVTVHRLPAPAYAVPGLLDWVNRCVRVELTLRTAELKRLGLRTIGDWTPERVAEIWRCYVDKLDFAENAAMTRDVCELAGFLSARELDAVAAWRAGNDLRAGRSRAAYYRLRKRLKETVGIDIATSVPKSNVLPLRRVVEAKPALRPLWADHLDAALGRAA